MLGKPIGEGDDYAESWEVAPPIFTSFGPKVARGGCRLRCKPSPPERGMDEIADLCGHVLMFVQLRKYLGAKNGDFRVIHLLSFDKPGDAVMPRRDTE